MTGILDYHHCDYIIEFQISLLISLTEKGTVGSLTKMVMMEFQ